MKKNSWAAIVLILLLSQNLYAQSYKEGHLFGLSLNAGKGEFANALSWSHYHGIDKKSRFKIGYGIRLTNYFAKNNEYITAPAKYTTGKESFAALFEPKRLEDNFDTIQFSKAQVNALNAAIFLSYTPPILGDKLDIGMNIDAVGFSFAARQQATFRGRGGFNDGAVSTLPTALNALLISDSDIGSLNSEWYVRYWIKPSIAVKVGFEFLFTEFQTSDKIQPIPNTNEFNDRFRKKSSLAMIGIQFAPFKK